MMSIYDILFYMSAKEKAVLLRKKGYAYSYIAEATGLSKSTLSYHLAGLSYKPNEYTKQHLSNARVEANITKNKKKLQSISRAKRCAQEDIGMLTSRDLLLLGIGLYLGEGSKTQNLVRLVNTDPKVVQLFIKWLKMFGLRNKNIAIRIHLYPDSDVHISEQFWLKKTCLPKSSLQKASIDTRANKNRKRNKVHINGTAHVTVRANGEKQFGVELSRKIGAYMQEVLQ